MGEKPQGFKEVNLSAAVAAIESPEEDSHREERNSNGMTKVEDALEAILRAAERFTENPARMYNTIITAAMEFPELVATPYAGARIRKMFSRVSPAEDAKRLARDYILSVSGDEDKDEERLATLINMHTEKLVREIVNEVRNIAYTSFREGYSKKFGYFAQSTASVMCGNLEKRLLPSLE